MFQGILFSFVGLLLSVTIKLAIAVPLVSLLPGAEIL
jgi:hypothetical protein